MTPLEYEATEAESILISGEPIKKIFDISARFELPPPNVMYILGAPSPSDIRKLSKDSTLIIIVFVPARSAYVVSQAVLTNTLQYKNAFNLQHRICINSIPLDPINKGYMDACANIIESYRNACTPDCWYRPTAFDKVE